MFEYATNVLQVFDSSLLKFYRNDNPVTMHFFGKHMSSWKKARAYAR